MNGEMIKDLVLGVKKNRTSASSLVREAYEKIKKYDEYNSVISVMPEYALEKAKDIDERLKRGEEVGKLAGIPFLTKDNFLTIKGRTTVASNFLDNFEAPLQASVIEKLEAAGAICIGKTNLDAFAHGSSTENSVFGVTKNSKDKERVAGGSSGGSAVAVALDIVPFALGTDTGGSIRQPSSFNGVAGLKPTYGAVSRFGVVAMASSTDCIGPIAKNCQDLELIMSVIAGQDERDGTTVPDFYKTVNKSEKLKVGIIKECLDNTVDKDVGKTIYDYAEKLKQFGHTVEEVSLPMTKYAVAMYYVIVPAEISSNLARYDGVRYGKRANSLSLNSLYGESRDQGFTRENKRRILIGSYVLSSGYFDAYYNKAQKARTLLINEYRELFKDYDLLLSPTAPTPAFKIGELTKDAVKMYMADAMTVPPSLAGLPALSIPFGQTNSGLPIGVQLIGPYQSDAKLLALGRETEKING